MEENMSDASNLIDEIKQVIEITARTDERIKMIAEAQQYSNVRLNTFVDQHNLLMNRVQMLETNGPRHHEKPLAEITDVIEGIDRRLKDIEEHKANYKHRIQTIIGYLWQGVFVIALGYLLYRMGLSSPPIP